jgi:hypothetical protein
VDRGRVRAGLSHQAGLLHSRCVRLAHTDGSVRLLDRAHARVGYPQRVCRRRVRVAEGLRARVPAHRWPRPVGSPPRVPHTPPGAGASCCFLLSMLFGDGVAHALFGDKVGEELSVGHDG